MKRRIIYFTVIISIIILAIVLVSCDDKDNEGSTNFEEGEASNLNDPTLESDYPSIDRNGVIKLSGLTIVDRELVACERTLTDVQVPKGVTEIGSEAFKSCGKLKSIVIPKTVTKIGANAFEGCSALKNIDVPNSVTSIGSSAFLGCIALNSITLPVLGDGTASTSFLGYYFGATSYNNNITAVPSNLKNFTLTAGKTIPVGAFYGCISLVNVSIPNTIIKIEDQAFNGCISLKDISMPSSLVRIGEWAFSSCVSLSELNIGESVIEIGEFAFNGCSNLLNISLPSCLAKIGDGAFVGCASLFELKLLDGLIEIGSFAFKDCISLLKVEIPSSVTSIGSTAFSGCNKLVQIKNLSGQNLNGLPSNYEQEIITSSSHNFANSLVVDSDGYITYTVEEKKYLMGYVGYENSLDITNKNISEIYQYALYDNDKIINIVLPEKLDGIGDFAFSECDKLVMPTLPNGITVSGNIFTNPANNFFINFEKAFNSLGKNSIVKEDISFSFAFDFRLGCEKITFDLGVKFDIVCDNDNLNNAVHIAIIDNDGTITIKDDVIIDVYYFMADSDAIYVDMLDAKYKLEFDEKNVGDDSLFSILTTMLSENDSAVSSVFDVKPLIKSIAQSFGEDFSLDSLLQIVGESIFGIDAKEGIKSVSDLIGVEGETFTELCLALSEIIFDDETNCITITIEDGVNHWNASIGRLIKGLITGILPNGIFDGNSTLEIGFGVDSNGVLDNCQIFATTAPIGLGNDAIIYEIMLALKEFEIKGIEAEANPFNLTKADYCENCIVDAKLNFDFKQSLLNLTLKELSNDESNANDFYDICTAFEKNFETFKNLIYIPSELEIEGKLDFEFKGKLSANNEIGFSSIYLLVYYTSYTDMIKNKCAEIVYSETDALNGIGAIKVLIDNEALKNNYVKAMRDCLLVKIITELYCDENKALYNNYETQINGMFDVIENNVGNFELLDINILSLLKSICFNGEFIEKNIASEYALKTINFINVEKAALNDAFVKIDDAYYKVICDALTLEKVLNKVGEDYLASDIKQISGGLYDGRFVALERKNGIDYAYSYEELYAIYSSSTISSVYETKLVYKNLFGMLSDALSVTEDNTITISSADGLWETLFKYAGPAQALESAYLGNVADEYGYEEMGIISTIATYSGDSINGYEGASNAEELYASIYKLSKCAIRRLTDAGILPGIKLVATGEGKGTYGYDTTDVDQITIIKGGDESFNIEYTYDAVDGKNVFYQTGSTLTKEQAVLLWRVTAGNATVEEVNGLRAEYGAAALATAQDAIDSCYEEGVVNVLGKMFAGSGLVADCYEEGKLDGQKFFDKLLALDAEIVIAPTAKDLTLTVAIKDGSATIASVLFNFAMSTSTETINAFNNAIETFNNNFGAV